MRHEGLALVAFAWLGCAPSHGVSDEANPLPGLTVTDDRVEQQLIQSDVVFAGDVIDFYRSPPPVEPHGDYFAPVTFRVLRVFKGRELVKGDSVTVYQLARWPSPLVDENLRLRPTIFGQRRTLVVFAKQEGSFLNSRDGVVAATTNVLELLDRRSRR